MENNLNQNSEPNLLKRSYIRFLTAKIVKKLTAITISSALVLSLAACDEVLDSNGNVVQLPTTPGIHTPGGTETPNPGNNQNDVNNPGNTTDPGTTTPDIPEIPGRDPIDTTGHSQILQNIINDPYYDYLFAKIVNSTDIVDGWEYQPHPYAFYEDQGIDLEPLKNGQSEAYTMSYILDKEPNNLYMYTRILINNTYYQNYLLKYEITDAEYNDYHLMHTGYGEYKFYFQSVFMNNEIAKSRDPEIVSSSKVTKLAQESLTESFQQVKLTTTENCDIFLMDINPSAGTFVIYLVPRMDNKKEMFIDTNIAVLQCGGGIRTENGAYSYPSILQHVNDRGYEKIDAEVFLTQSARLNLVASRDYENEDNR